MRGFFQALGDCLALAEIRKCRHLALNITPRARRLVLLQIHRKPRVLIHSLNIRQNSGANWGWRILLIRRRNWVAVKAIQRNL